MILRPVQPAVQEFDSSAASPYHWQHIRPDSELPTFPDRLSLRSLCALELAANVDSLDSSHFEYGSWPCWLLVWSHVLRMKLDTPDVFRSFYKHFGKRLKCHGLSAGSARDAAIALCVVALFHRIDNLFSNVVHLDFSRFLSVPHALVTVDCSRNDHLSVDNLLNLCNISGLAAVDFSGLSLVDDRFLYTFMQALAAKNTTFKVLRVVNCPNVSRTGLLRVLLDENVLSKVPVCYLETDVSLFKSTFAPTAELVPVENAPWLLLGEASVHTNRLGKYPLAKKCQYLSRTQSVFELSGNLLWDLKIFPGAVDVSNTTDLRQKYNLAWEKRLHAALVKPAYNPYCYIRGNHGKTSEKRKKLPKQEPQHKPINKPAKKPRLVTSNPSAFFGMH